MTEGQPDKIDFNGLVAGLATSAVAVLSQVEMLLGSGGEGAPPVEGGGEPLSPEEARKRLEDGLTGARQLIDMLTVLKEKTEGNLTPEEEELLGTALGELRIRFVSLAGQAEAIG